MRPGGTRAAFPAETEADFVIDNFRFQSGQTLPEVRLHYTTLGTPHENAHGEIDNAVLLLHGTPVTGRSFLSPSLGEHLFGPGQPLDANTFFVILPDGLGRGGSSKPSDGLRMRFPHYGYGDVVTGQYRLVVEGLGIRRLRLVLGLSMGGMHAWMWGERYPDAMDAVMPVGCEPVEISGRNFLWRRLISEAIRNDPGWHHGNYERQPYHFARFLPIFDIMVRSPVRLHEDAPTGVRADKLYDDLISQYSTVDANDYLHWFESSYDYGCPPLQLEKIKARLLAVNFADDEVCPPELGVMEREMRRVKHGRFVTIPAGPTTNGHLSLLIAELWKQYILQLLAH